MDRTLRAALVAAAITFGTLTFFGLFLGFPPLGTLLTAAVCGALAAALIVLAARRAESFEPPTPPRPGFPGPPESADPAADEPGADDPASDER